MRAILAVSLGLLAASCGSSAKPALPVVVCSSATATGLSAFAPADIGVYLDSADQLLTPVAADIQTYLAASWNMPTLTVSRTAPDFSKRVTIWFSTSDSAAAAAGVTLQSGYALKRTDHDTGSAVVVVYAKSSQNLAYGAYAFLEAAGIRFFHPKDELVPKRTGPALPVSLNVERTPRVPLRGLQVHTLHPIEYFETFNHATDANLADAKLFIDWLVKTGQNYVQWPLLSTVNFDGWRPHAQAIIDYAHGRGVQVGAVVQVWKVAALQNNYVLVTDAAHYQTGIDSAVAKLMQLPWDAVELGMGEFFAADPQPLVDWLSYATASLLAANPNLLVNAQNHVGNYPQFWVPYQGATRYYYQLPEFADARLGMSVHTLFFFDLYRDWAMYSHPDFHFQHDFLLKELPTRRVNYFPESAYWVTADVSVPQFFPEYVYARWNDLHRLTAEISEKGLPPLNGHILFSSGHEWGYWLTDYLTAKMLWDESATPDSLFADYAAAYGACQEDVASALSQFTSLQTKYLFDARLAPYVMGEDGLIDLAAAGTLKTVPPRVQFEDVLAMTGDAREAFTSKVLVPLQQFADEIEPLEGDVAARCRGADADLAPWCNELWDGMAIVRLRAQHSVLLYRAMVQLSEGNGGAAGASVAQAAKVTDLAAAVIHRREAHYRFDLARLTEAYDNPTIYKFGYLRQAHTQCYFHRREGQVGYLIDYGTPIGTDALPCND